MNVGEAVSYQTPWEWVKNVARFPVELYPFQQKSVNELAIHDRIALYYDMGTGKTFTSLAIALYKFGVNIDTTIIIVPPVLLDNWSRQIAKIPGSTQVIYRGTPAQRKALDLNKQFIIVGIQIFKKDFDHLNESMRYRNVFGIVDEAQMLKNSSSDNFKKVRDFFIARQLCLLTGTPLSSPLDGYAMVKLVTPPVYKTFYQFCAVHVGEVDFFKKPVTYVNLDLLSENLTLYAHRVLKEDVLLDLPEVVYSPLYYDLDPEHLKLYNRIADDQMVKLESGEKKDYTTSASALWNAMSQVPSNSEHFSEGKIKSTVLDLIDQVMDGLGSEKLVIFTHYIMTTERVRDHLPQHKPAVLYGKTKDRQAEIDRFVNDPECKVLVANLRAGSAGLDSLQHVCRSMLFVELPYRAAEFRQAVGRLHRDGQRDAVNCMVAIANKTLVVKAWDSIQSNDTLIASIIRSPQTIRAALAGN